VLTGHDGRTAVFERRFDAAGTQSGVSRFAFAVDDPVTRAGAAAGRAATIAMAHPAAGDASPE
jgi:hypothetical protein